MTNINKDLFTKFSLILMFYLITIPLVFWEYFRATFPVLSLEKMIGLIMALLGTMFFYFDSRISIALRGPISFLTHMTLNDSFNYLSKFHVNVDHIRIFALSSGIIQPLFSCAKINVNKCDILLRDFSQEELKADENIRYQNHINLMIIEWDRDKERGKIKEIDVQRYYFLPTEYCVIVDDKAMILGIYSPIYFSWGSAIDPVLITNSTKEGSNLIKKYTDRFDRMKEDIKDGPQKKKW